MRTTYVVDIETDGLRSTKIHVMSVGYKKEDGTWAVGSTNSYEKMAKIMENPDNIIIGHFFKMFDAVELERVLGIEVKATVIDTLALSWYIFPTRAQGKFGLEHFGRDYGIKKPEIDDWENLTYAEYKHRCEEDVRINIALWEDISKRMMELYENDLDAVHNFIKYLMFKMDCLVKQQEIGTRIDLKKVKENMEILKPMLEKREDILKKAMPQKVDKVKPDKMYLERVYKAPNVVYKKDGSLSVSGERWLSLLKEKGLPEDSKEFVDKRMSKAGEAWYEHLREGGWPLDTEITYKDANASSIDQVKEWLFSLGWEPDYFKDGANGPIPQVRDNDKNLCKSVMALADKEPAIHALDGISVIEHRMGILKAFLDTSDEDGFTIAKGNGFTNTLRLKHSKPLVNLPGVTGRIHKCMEKGMTKEEAVEENLRDGQLIRECIIPRDGHVLCGSDISSLEDSTKRHYMWDYDPEYVEEQMEEGFDPHLDLAVRAGAMTQEEADEHKLYSATEGEEGVSHKHIRDLYKVANYSAIYGVGAVKLADTLGITSREARRIIQSYWDRNWSIRQLPNDIQKKVDSHGQMWIFNPVSKFWYSIRAEKDIFSTLNQGTGAFIFDVWIKYMNMKGVYPFLQYHDEVLALVKKGDEEDVREYVVEAMEKVNGLLKLNIEIKVDVKFGEDYAEVH